jgi:hypothetical protein
MLQTWAWFLISVAAIIIWLLIGHDFFHIDQRDGPLLYWVTLWLAIITSALLGIALVIAATATVIDWVL